MKIEVNDENFKSEVLESDMPVMVDFWAEWCGPCKALNPVISEIAEEYFGRVKVCSLNIDEARTVSGEYGIMSIPTLIVFKGGQVIDKIIGARPKAEIVGVIDSHIS